MKPGLTVGGLGHKKKKSAAPTMKKGLPKKKAGLSSFYKKWNANDPLTGKTLKREINARTRLEYDPLERQLNRESNASAFREHSEIPAWYQGYQNVLSQLSNQSGAAHTQAMSNINNVSQQAGQQDAADRAAIAQRLQADATRRGGTVDPSIDIGSTNASSARANLLSQMQGTLAGQHQNQSNFFTGLQGVGYQQQREAMDRERAKGSEIFADMRKLAKEKGDYRSQLLGELRETERKFGLEKGALGIDKKELGEKIRHNRAGENIDRLTERGRNRRDRKNRRQDARQHGEDLAEDKRHHKKTEKADAKGKTKKLG